MSDMKGFSHWREAGASGAYRPFPDKPYFRPLVQIFQLEPVNFARNNYELLFCFICGTLTDITNLLWAAGADS